MFTNACLQEIGNADQSDSSIPSAATPEDTSPSKNIVCIFWSYHDNSGSDLLPLLLVMEAAKNGLSSWRLAKTERIPLGD
jgi:hypothetical protein